MIRDFLVYVWAPCTMGRLSLLVLLAWWAAYEVGSVAAVVAVAVVLLEVATVLEASRIGAAMGGDE